MGDTIRKKLALIVGMQSGAAVKGMNLLRQKMRAFGEFAMRWGKRAALGILAIGAAIIKVGMDFDTAMREVWTLMPKASKTALDAMGQQVLDLAQKYGKSSKDIAKALYDVVSAQIPVAYQMEVLTAGTKAAVAGVTSVGEATSALISVMKVFGTEAGSASLVMDKLFKIVEYGRLTFADLASGIGRLLPAAKDAGVSFEEVGAALAMTTQGGLSSAESVTALRMMFLAMAAPVDEAAKEMNRLGMTFVDVEGKLLPLQEVLRQFVGLNLAQMKEIIPGVRGLQGLSGLRREFETLEATLEGVTDAFGATDLAVLKMLGGLRAQWGRVVQTLKRAGIELYDMFQDDLVEAVDVLQKKFGELVVWIKANRGRIIDWGVTFKESLQSVWGTARPLFEFLWNHRKTIAVTFGVVIAGTLTAKLYAAIVAVKLMTVAMAGLLVSMGPIGWGLLAIGAGALYMTEGLRKATGDAERFNRMTAKLEERVEKIKAFREEAAKLGGRLEIVRIKTETGVEKVELLVLAGQKLGKIDLNNLGEGMVRVNVNTDNATTAMERLRKKTEETANVAKTVAEEMEKAAQAITYGLSMPGFERRIPTMPERPRYAPRIPSEMRISIVAPPRGVSPSDMFREIMESAEGISVKLKESLEKWGEGREESLLFEEELIEGSYQRRWEFLEKQTALMETMEKQFAWPTIPSIPEVEQFAWPTIPSIPGFELPAIPITDTRGLPERLQEAMASLDVVPQTMKESFEKWNEEREAYLGTTEEMTEASWDKQTELRTQGIALAEKAQKLSQNKMYKFGVQMYSLEEKRVFEFADRFTGAIGGAMGFAENAALAGARAIISAYGEISRTLIFARIAAGDPMAYFELATIAFETLASLRRIAELEKEQTKRKEERRRYQEEAEDERENYGKTIGQAPQGKVIAPVLNIAPEGDVYFSQDGMEAAGKALVDVVKQAMDDGEIAVA